MIANTNSASRFRPQAPSPAFGGGRPSPVMGAFAPGNQNDLRFQTVAGLNQPSISQTNTAPAQQSLEQAGRMAQAQNPAQAADTAAARAQMMQRLNSLQGPDRASLANQTFQLMRERSEGAFNQGVRNIGRAAARFGRTGSGMTTSELGDAFVRRENELSRAKRDLAIDAAGRALDDRQAILGATQSVAGQLDQFDAGRFSRGMDQARFNTEMANQQFALARVNRTDAESDRAYEAQRRAELRGERDYQNQMERQAFERGLTRFQMERQATDDNWQRQMQLRQLLAGLSATPR